MQPLYRGFDGLDVSLAGSITPELSRHFEETKEQAQETRRDALLDWNGVRMLVSESGARGGYAFRASTGPFGATWFFKKPTARDPWGIRVSCNSFNLAVKGLGGARAELYRTLELLGIALGPEGESLGRIDYAVDFLAPEFLLVPEHFVMHSNANRSDHIEHPEVTCHGRSGRVTSVTIGKMPGRQVIVYDKRAEVIARAKAGWWEIWNAALAELGREPLNAQDAAESRIWRVELRAGKRHLKDLWNIRTWADLDRQFGDVVVATLNAIRHTQPGQDSNRSRWPESLLWQCVRRETASDLFEMQAGVAPASVRRVQKEAHDRLLFGQMTGLLTARAALAGIDAHELPAFASAAGQDMAREIASAPSRFARKLARAAGRFGIDNAQ